MNYIDSLFDSALTEKIGEITIDKISKRICKSKPK